MTCIAASKALDGTIWMGGDSAASCAGSGRLIIRNDTKVFEKGEFLIGYTTSFRMGQLLKYQLRVGEQTVRDDLEFMSTSFIEAVRKVLKAGGFTKVENEQEEGGAFLVGYRGTIYFVESDFQVGVNKCDYAACGSGEEFAMGVMHCLSGQMVTGEKAVLAALQAAECHNAYVRAPFIVKSQTKKKR